MASTSKAARDVTELTPLDANHAQLLKLAKELPKEEQCREMHFALDAYELFRKATAVLQEEDPDKLTLKDCFQALGDLFNGYSLLLSFPLPDHNNLTTEFYKLLCKHAGMTPKLHVSRFTADPDFFNELLKHPDPVIATGAASLLYIELNMIVVKEAAKVIGVHYKDDKEMSEAARKFYTMLAPEEVLVGWWLMIRNLEPAARHAADKAFKELGVELDVYLIDCMLLDLALLIIPSEFLSKPDGAWMLEMLKTLSQERLTRVPEDSVDLFRVYHSICRCLEHEDKPKIEMAKERHPWLLKAAALAERLDCPNEACETYKLISTGVLDGAMGSTYNVKDDVSVWWTKIEEALPRARAWRTDETWSQLAMIESEIRCNRKFDEFAKKDIRPRS